MNKFKLPQRVRQVRRHPIFAGKGGMIEMQRLLVDGARILGDVRVFVGHGRFGQHWQTVDC